MLNGSAASLDDLLAVQTRAERGVRVGTHDSDLRVFVGNYRDGQPAVALVSQDYDPAALAQARQDIETDTRLSLSQRAQARLNLDVMNHLYVTVRAAQTRTFKDRHGATYNEFQAFFDPEGLQRDGLRLDTPVNTLVVRNLGKERQGVVGFTSPLSADGSITVNADAYTASMHQMQKDYGMSKDLASRVVVYHELLHRVNSDVDIANLQALNQGHEVARFAVEASNEYKMVGRLLDLADRAGTKGLRQDYLAGVAMSMDRALTQTANYFLNTALEQATSAGMRGETAFAFAQQSMAREMGVHVDAFGKALAARSGLGAGDVQSLLANMKSCCGYTKDRVAGVYQATLKAPAAPQQIAA